MKRVLLSISILLLAINSFSQTPKLYQALSQYYKVYTDVGEEFATEISVKMEAALQLYNNIFHLDLSKLQTKFKVTIYGNKTGFDTYLNRLLGQTRDDFVYIHYTDARKSELVGFKKDDEKDLLASLLHQGLIQFIKSFIPNVPYWMSEGVAAYIENSSYTASSSASTGTDGTATGTGSGTTTDGKTGDEEFTDSATAKTAAGSFILNKSLVWLDSLKALLKGESGNSVMPLDELLVIDKEKTVSLINIFYPQAWGLVYFLLNTPDKEYNRLFWDSLQVLDPALTLKDNSEAVKNKVFKWKNMDTLYKDFKAFILSLKTFNDYITDGLDLYNSNTLDKAAESFRKAVDVRPSHYFAYYYLGLISYTNKDYFTAEEFYFKALERGADTALTYYALGVNAYADNKYENAVSYLNSAATNDPAKYKEKADLLLKRIESEKADADLYMNSGDTSGGDKTDKTTTDGKGTSTTADDELEYEFPEDDGSGK